MNKKFKIKHLSKKWAQVSITRAGYYLKPKTLRLRNMLAVVVLRLRIICQKRVIYYIYLFLSEIKFVFLLKTYLLHRIPKLKQGFIDFAI